MHQPCSSSAYSMHWFPLELCQRGFCSHLPSVGKVGFFFTAIYRVAVGKGGLKSCVQAFGANHFDEDNQEERIWKE
ncbi:protein NRT1/ PTR FAMILY 8.1-like isoform X2 [Amborella trichopoda]|uniref:protein NRT1/ PTR FAMILY 8.1-like isoform X2 n=1 Tax=Amborella trichopoda TaxID=13333 RepID=UPI0009BE24A9|nr:protein NRT1/ PTR FAMILY 8.1-like isoform X2 [Amborella trichopoda]|eukprot:XP_020528391.1 protein NRT1/ PTR FAMILY 8.1-like isoform X2 [Amborella trichopoda]